MSDAIERAAAILGDLAVRDVLLAPLTTYDVGGPAALMCRPASVEDLGRIADALAASGLELLVIGRGSNLLVADSGFPGIALSLERMASGHVVEESGPSEVTVVAGGATPLQPLAADLAAAGLTGFEWAAGVPGSVGGAVRMNAGAHGSDMRACLVAAHLVDLRTGRDAWLPAERLGMRFRGSDIASHQVVVAARFRVALGDRSAAMAEVERITVWRRDNQPGGRTCGSVYINSVPGEVRAAELVQSAGLRGHELGSASVPARHANFIRVRKGGSAADVLALIRLVRERVAATTGFLIHPEVRLAGFEGVADVVQHDERGVAL